MAKTITVTLSDAQYKAFEHVAYDPIGWVQNCVDERCRVAIEEIARKEIDRKLAAGESISGTKEEIVLAANIRTAKEISEEHNATLSGSQ
jgi:hypothetical protein